MADFNLNGPTGAYEDRVYGDHRSADEVAEDNMQERKEEALEVCRETAAKLLNIHGVSKNILKSYAAVKKLANKPESYRLEDYVAELIHEACEDFTYNDSQNDDYLPETE